MKKKLISIVGARPQFIKLAPFSKVIRKYFNEVIINSGQHYDGNMAQIFFDEMGIPEPDYNLGVSTGSHANQTAKILAEIEPVLIKEKPECIIVFGDTNTTLAATLAASKLCIPILHIEAGLRSFDRRMPEEQNRIVADHLSTILACPTLKSVDNLRDEGITNNVYFTGDLMFDSVNLFKDMFEERSLSVKASNYYVLTMHRPSNVDSKDQLQKLFDSFQVIEQTFVFPIHPRTKKNIHELSIDIPENIMITDALGYLDMMSLINRSIGVFTDSGGLQKEAFFLNKKCVTLRDTTEWVETIDAKYNILALKENGDVELEKIVSFLNCNVTASEKLAPYGDGKAAESIAKILMSSL